MQLKKILVFLFLIVFISSSNSIFAEEFLITVSDRTNEIVFDGKWSHNTEWKASSEKFINIEETKFVIRGAHDYNSLYFLIDVISDITPDTNGDRSLICLISKNQQDLEKMEKCFLIVFNGKYPITLIPHEMFEDKGSWRSIQNNSELIAIGTISSVNDRYSKIPHVSYEYKIPIDEIGRSDIYGFYVQVFDASKNEFANWPEQSKNEFYPFIAPSELWGELISPDKSIPEFSLSIIIMTVSFVIIVGFSKTKNLMKI